MNHSSSDTASALVLGAVAYSPKVVTIWEGFKEYFEKHGLEFDYILYSNYERQVEALFNETIHIAWNSPLAWLRAARMGQALRKPVRALLMRDSDQDLHSTLLVKKSGKIRSLNDLRGQTIGVGAIDSPQATLLPLEMLRRAGLEPSKDLHIRHFNVLPGKHGDHVGGELEAAQALMKGEVDACCVLSSNFEAFQKDGTLSEEVVPLAETPKFDHCNFTVGSHAPASQTERFRELLLGMSYEDPQVKHLLDLEGLKAWKEGRVSGYADLDSAVTTTCFYDSKGDIQVSDYRF